MNDITQVTYNANETTSLRYTAANDIAQALQYLISINPNNTVSLEQAIQGSTVNDSTEQNVAYAYALIFYVFKTLSDEGQKRPNNEVLKLMLKQSFGKNSEDNIQHAFEIYRALQEIWKNNKATLALFDTLHPDNFIPWFNSINSDKPNQTDRKFSNQLANTLNSVQIIQDTDITRNTVKVGYHATQDLPPMTPPYPKDNSGVAPFTSRAKNYKRFENTVDLTHIHRPGIIMTKAQTLNHPIQINHSNDEVSRGNSTIKQSGYGTDRMHTQIIERSQHATQSKTFNIKTALSQPHIPRPAYSQLTYDWVKTEFERYMQMNNNDISIAFLDFRIALDSENPIHAYAIEILVKLVYEQYLAVNNNNPILAYTTTVSGIIELTRYRGPNKTVLYSGQSEAKHLLALVSEANKKACLKILFTAFMNENNSRVSAGLSHTLDCLDPTLHEQDKKHVIGFAYDENQKVMGENSYNYTRNYFTPSTNLEKEICYLIEHAYSSPNDSAVDKFGKILQQLNDTDKKIYIQYAAPLAFKKMKTIEEIIALNAVFKNQPNYNELLKLARTRIIELVKAAQAPNTETSAASNTTATPLLYDLPKLMQHAIVADHRGAKKVFCGLVNTDTQNDIETIMQARATSAVG